MKKFTHIFYLSTLILTLSPIAVFANTAVPAGQSEFDTSAAAQTSPSYVLLTPLPCVGVSNGTTCTGGANGSSQIKQIGIQDYLLYVFRLAIALTVFLAVVMTIWGGFKYMTTEAVLGKGEARKTIENAVLGLLLALASYLILYTINPNLVNLSKVAVPKLNVAVDQQLQNNIGNLNSSANQTAISSDAALTANRNAASQAQSDLQNAQDNVAQLQQQIDSCGPDGSFCDPITYGNLQDQLSSAQQDVATYNGQVATQNGLAAMNTAVVQSSRLVDITNTDTGVQNPADAAATIAGNLTTLQTNYDSSIAAITANGNNDPTNIQMLNTQFQYASSTLVDELALLQAKADPSKAVIALQTITAEDAIMANNSSTTLQQQYNAQSSSTRAALQALVTQYNAQDYNTQHLGP